jgi:hypothetical protein
LERHRCPASAEVATNRVRAATWSGWPDGHPKPMYAKEIVMRKTLQVMSFMALAAAGGLAPACAESLVLHNIRQDLPPGWKLDVIEQEGEKGHPHGLDEPLFRADFTNPHQQILAPSSGNTPRKLNPRIQLYFYGLDSKSHVMKVIERERKYSWDIPIYFGETKDYLVVTSPSYVNYGVFTEDAKKKIRPMWEVLRKHIEHKEDKTVDKLVEPSHRATGNQPSQFRMFLDPRSVRTL